MAPRPNTSLPLLLFHLFIASFCLWNLSAVHDRARVPFGTVDDGDATVVGRIIDTLRSGGVRTGDRLLAWKGSPVAMPQHVELLADLSSIGDTVGVTLGRDGEVLNATIELVPFYPSYRFAVVMGVAGMTVLVLALFVYLKRPADPAALLLHWSLLSLATVTMMTQGPIEAGSLLSAARRSVLFLSYNLTAGCFFLFAVSFPRPLLTGRAWKASALLTAFIGLAAALSWYHIDALSTGQAASFRSFQRLYDVFHLVFLVVLLVGLAYIFAGYAHERMPERRMALRWIFYGLLVGTSPFLLLVVLPQLWGPDLLAPEELATFFTLAIPLSLVVAFFRYRVFSIEIQHHLRLTSGLLRLALALLQLLLAAIVLSVVWEEIIFGSHVYVMLSFGLLLIILSPVRTRLEKLLEEAMFPARFNPTHLLSAMSDRLRGLYVASDAGPLLAEEVGQMIPRLQFAWFSWTGSSLHQDVSPTAGFPRSLIPGPRFTQDMRAGTLIADGSSIRGAEPVPVPAHRTWLAENGLSLVIPVQSRAQGLFGALCARREQGADQLEQGELQLVLTCCSQTAAAIEHLRLQETMIVEQRKRRQLEELSRLKSHFVSSVSHDLRTPLTSMQMFLEMLGKSGLTVRERNEYLAIMQDESQRLNRLVENVLDFARAEQGMTEFRFQPCALSPVLRNAARAMAGQFRAVGARYTVRIPSGLPRISADPQALERAFVNLLSNAYKYTGPRKRVSVTAALRGNTVRVTVTDNGIGITSDELPKVFDPFFRVRDRETASSGGVGLGLSLVKRTVERHGGSVSIRSRKGKGTTVTVSLPVQTTIKG